MKSGGGDAGAGALRLPLKLHSETAGLFSCYHVNSDLRILLLILVLVKPSGGSPAPSLP